MSADMEGVLYKWTNYMTGWQPRWFVLDDGIISYYDCQDDVVKGSKGSIKMSVCEIKVHPTDSGRLELIIPGEQHFYVRAVNAAERQRWLVALGSSKAGLLDTRTKTEREQAERTDSLRTKMSELRLYCDLLVQQVHTLQHCHHATSCHDITSCSAPLGGDVTSCSDITSSPHSPNSETRLEAASLLSATCSTFIRTLEECVSLADAHLLPDSAHSPVSPSPLQMTRMKRSISHPGTYSFDRWGQRSAQRRTRTCSDTEAGRTGYDSDRALPCLRGSVNGIPEERGGGASPRGGGASPRGGGASPRATSDTDTPETDVSM